MPTFVFPLALGLVLLLCGAYLLHQWYTGELGDDVDGEHSNYDQGYDKGYVQGADDGDESGYERGRTDEQSDATVPLNDTLQEIADLWPVGYRQSKMEEGDWQAVAEDMYEKAIAAL